MLPIPKIKTRQPQTEVERDGIAQGLHPLVARILASRPLPPGMRAHELLALKLNDLEHPNRMRDMQKAALRVAQAVIAGEIIALETDHDCDGQTSHAVLYSNLAQHFKHPIDKLQSYIGHRLTEGYGLSAAVAARILAHDPRPSLVITADNGSADEPRIKQLKDAGIDVIVTDHHAVPVTELPVSAYAFINPTRVDCNYTDKYIAGCMVAWLLMAATRQVLIEREFLPSTAPKLLDSLDYVAVGTIADCVSIARSKNNRPVVNYGLQLISRGTRPCWRVLRPLLSDPVNAEDLAFKVGPLLNSDGRLASAFGSVNFLLTNSDAEAATQVVELQQQNQQRKLIQHNITTQSLLQALEQVQQRQFSICLYLEHGHVGVHGISASKIKDYFGRPTAIFALKVGMAENIISGSIRTVDGFHVRNGLQYIADAAPGVLIAFGGHQGAGGVTLRLADFAKFSALFEQAVAQQLKASDLGPVIWTDGELGSKNINLDILETLKSLEPFGREFEQPVFNVNAVVLALSVIGDGTHARIVLDIDGKPQRGVWFNFRQTNTDPLPVAVGDSVVAVFALKLNAYAGKRTCELQIHMLQRRAV